MTTEEFSNEFEVLLNDNNFATEHGLLPLVVNISLDEYEKSVFLTKALEFLVVLLYNGYSPYGSGFEDTEILKRYFSDTIRTAINSNPLTSEFSISRNKSFIFSLEEDVLFITFETAKLGDYACKCLNLKWIEVVPTTQDELHRIEANPFRGVSNKRALRLDISDNKVEIISKYDLTTYKYRYIKKPNPIILTDLYEGLSINGKSERSECELHPYFHRLILERAVLNVLQTKAAALLLIRLMQLQLQLYEQPYVAPLSALLLQEPQQTVDDLLQEQGEQQ